MATRQNNIETSPDPLGDAAAQAEEAERRRRVHADEETPEERVPVSSKRAANEVPTVPPPPVAAYPPPESIPPGPTSTPPEVSGIRAASSLREPRRSSNPTGNVVGRRPSQNFAIVDEVVANLKKDWRSE